MTPPTRRRRLRHPLRLSALLIAVALGVLGYRIWKGQAVPPGGATAASAVDARQESSTNNRFVLLLLGVDERSEDVGRSDTIMVAAIDYDRRTAELLSIPRDTFARIPGHGWNKINAAYAKGAAVPEVGDGAREGAPMDVRRGAELAARTISELAGLPVQHWAVVSIAGFSKLVDRVGGVDGHASSENPLPGRTPAPERRRCDEVCPLPVR